MKPLATWRNKIDGSRYVQVCIWDSVDNLRAHTDSDDAIAMCRRLPYRVDLDTETPIIGKMFARIHLPITHVGAGIVAHEIQHLILFWIDVFGIGLPESEEYVCRITGDVTRRFWSSFYAKFETEET